MTALAALGAAVEANLAAHYAYLGRAAGADLGDEGDLLWVITGVPSATQNGVVRARLGHLSPGPALPALRRSLSYIYSCHPSLR
jgi:hypothetical protein